MAKPEPVEPLYLMAARAIRETEAYLADCLRHPERAVRIPVVRVGQARFVPSFSEAFWADVLTSGP